ncbi:hypothetical protein MBLNU230_g5380t1 [Neophaeotheca triangularis]
MPQTDEAAMWFAAVYQAVQQIPYGKVTSYGHIALLLGYPQRARQVGVCLKHLPSATDQPTARYNSDTVPWQRVINSKGGISPRGPGGAERQAEVLETEGVEAVQGRMGEYEVDMSVYGWRPNRLPNDSSDEEEDDEA